MLKKLLKGQFLFVQEGIQRVSVFAGSVRSQLKGGGKLCMQLEATAFSLCVPKIMTIAVSSSYRTGDSCSNIHNGGLCIKNNTHINKSV